MLNTDLDVEELLNHWATRQERELSSDEGGEHLLILTFFNHSELIFSNVFTLADH